MPEFDESMFNDQPPTDEKRKEKAIEEANTKLKAAAKKTAKKAAKKPGRKPKEKPKDTERFVCNRFPNYKILLGPKVLAFEKGVFITSDKEEIKAIQEDRYFGVFIHADNLELHNRRER